MKVILLENIKGVGKKFEVKNVSDGYARNYLLPKRKVEIANKANLKKIELYQSALKKLEATRKANLKTISQKLEKLTLEIPEKVGEKGKLFESVTKQKIADLLNQQNLPIHKSQVILDQPIKTVGNFQVKIKLSPQIASQIQVRVKPLAH